MIIGGTKKYIIGFKKPFHTCFNSSLCELKYTEKNKIIPSFVISEGCAEPNTGRLIHLLAPFIVLPKSWYQN